jgi:lipopolysaccharide/colanic/teichoic acid biosynthesis glycosyltransferase
MFKRLFDIFIALLLGISCLPLTLALALAVKLESSGPAIHPSLRVGKGGRLFHYFRLRTMTGEPLQKTAVGKIIGNLSLDELPVFWNILKGDLSFVGPRPEIPEKVDLADPDWQIILTIRPGITGLGLLKYLDAYNQTDVQQRIEPDVYYALNHSLWFDMKLLGKTFLLWLKMGHLKGKL